MSLADRLDHRTSTCEKRPSIGRHRSQHELLNRIFSAGSRKGMDQKTGHVCVVVVVVVVVSFFKV